jgi:creatinine amidohydrolase
MKVSEMNWMQVAEAVTRDGRAVVPVGSVEQHGYLSLATDATLAERVACEAAEPLGVPVFPVLAYGITPYFLGFPGTVSLRLETYHRIVTDVLDSLSAHGFTHILFVNGHGGNKPGASILAEWMNGHRAVSAKWHDWWSAPRTWAAVQAVDPAASHASWMENFPWTRVPGVELPGDRKPMVDAARVRTMEAAALRAYLGDGSFGGVYAVPDEQVMGVWRVGVEETREAIEGPWA